jgi:hypothetical protein
MKTIIAAAMIFSSLSPRASADILFSDDFDAFSLGTTWKTGNEGAPPDQTLSVINHGSRRVLDIASSSDGTQNGRNIQTIQPISTFGLTSLVVETTFLLVRGYYAPVEVDLENSFGSARWWSAPWDRNSVAWDGRTSTGKTFSEYFGVGSVNPGSYYKVTFTLNMGGTSISVTNEAGDLVASNSTPQFTLADFQGQGIDVSIRQVKGPTGPTESYVDNITLTGTVPEPSAAALVIGGALLFIIARPRRLKLN